MTIKANCKINIGLDVLRRREDGFHELSTVMFPVKGLYDLIDFEVIEGDKVEFAGKGMVVDCAIENNLCVKAYNLMREHYPSVGGLKITLDKRVPFGAGLGGGSSDATAVILAVNELFGLNLSEERLIELAAMIGSDTPFFVRNTPQLCTGRGENMTPVEVDLEGRYLALIKPDINVSTREAYSGVKPAYPAESLSEAIQLPILKWQGRVKNDFEEHIFLAYPLLAQIKEELITSGALYAAMSGSGSTIFGIFEAQEDAKKAISKFEKLANCHIVKIS
ncbi:MAG: 4-(cytidine 5'-diphospho)-2-C-methyl-D-erythritol kinase [Rikenellaceae bacterium]